MADIEITGRIWTDEFPGWSWYRDDGTEWKKWGHFNELIEPDQSLFSWVNQGTATIDSTYGPSVLIAPAPGGAGDDIHLRVLTVIATPYDVLACFAPNIEPFDQISCGVVFRESSTGKLIFFRFMFDTTSAITKSDVIFSVDTYTNPTTFNSNYAVASAGFLRGAVIWLKMTDDGTDLIWSYSNDGVNFVIITTQSRTNFLALGPNQVGFAINSNTTSGAAGMTLLSWN
jgi:hypothetical protein